MVAVLLTGILFFVLLWGAGRSILPRLLPGVDFKLMVLAGFCVVPLVFIRSLCGLFLGLQKYVRFNILVVAPLTLYCVLNIGTALSSSISPVRVLSNYALAMFVMAVAALVMILQSGGVRFRVSRSVGFESLRNGVKSTLSAVLLFMLFRVDIFLINFFLGTEQAGLYSIAVLVSELLQKFANTSGTVIFPKIAKETDDRKGRRLSNRVLVFVGIVGLIFAVVLLFWGGRLIGMLFTEKFTPAFMPLRILLPGTVMMAMGKVILFSLWGKGFPKITIVLPLIAFILNLGLNLVLIPRWGIPVAAVSTSAAYIVFGISILLHLFLIQTTGLREPVQPEMQENTLLR
jgi:O-antigen/teichoic acid export membrane protein